MSYIIKDKIKIMANIFSKLSWMDSMLILGSYSQDRMDIYSDIDLYLFGTENQEWNKFTKDPIPIFNQIFSIISFSNKIPSKSPDLAMNDNLWILYISDEFIKIELHLYEKFTRANDVENLHRYFLASRPKKINNCLFFDRSGQISKYLNKWMQESISIESNNLLEQEIRKFLNYYESFFPPFNRGDLYRAHFQHNLCYYKLAKIIAIVFGVIDHIYSPRNLINKVLKSQKHNSKTVKNNKINAIKILQTSASTIAPLEMKQKLEQMYSYLVALLRINYFSLDITNKNLELFRNLVHQKYPPFFKFRDFGRSSLGEPYLKNKFLYRSSSLSRYSASKLLQKNLKLYGIKTIIDLRTEKECHKNPYNLDFFFPKEIRY